MLNSRTLRIYVYFWLVWTTKPPLVNKNNPDRCLPSILPIRQPFIHDPAHLTAIHTRSCPLDSQFTHRSNFDHQFSLQNLHASVSSQQNDNPFQEMNQNDLQTFTHIFAHQTYHFVEWRRRNDLRCTICPTNHNGDWLTDLRRTWRRVREFREVFSKNFFSDVVYLGFFQRKDSFQEKRKYLCQKMFNHHLLFNLFSQNTSHSKSTSRRPCGFITSTTMDAHIIFGLFFLLTFVEARCPSNCLCTRRFVAECFITATNQRLPLEVKILKIKGFLTQETRNELENVGNHFILFDDHCGRINNCQ